MGERIVDRGEKCTCRVEKSPRFRGRPRIWPLPGFSSGGGRADNTGVSPSPSDNASVDRRSVIKAAAAAAGLLAAGGAAAWAAAAGGDPVAGTPGASGSPLSAGRGGANTRSPANRGAGGEGGDGAGQGKHGSSNKEGKPADGGGDSSGAQQDQGDPGGQPTEGADGSSNPDDGGGNDGQPSDADKDSGDGPNKDNEGNGGKGDNDGDGDGNGNGGDPGVPALLQASAVPVGGGVVIPQHRIVVTQPQAGTFRCFGSRCTHAGCMVDAVTEGTIHCPCHGSLFDLSTGEPIAGPAPRALDSVPINVKSGGIYRA